MLAYMLQRYGGPDGALLADVPPPAPRPHDILVEVRAAGLNPVDFVVVDRAFPFAQIADALAYVEDGRAKGKVVVVEPA